MPMPRNPVVRAGAILRKGGVHRQSTSSHRHRGKRSLSDELDDWYAHSEDIDESADVCRGDDQQESVSRRAPGRKKGWGSTPFLFEWQCCFGLPPKNSSDIIRRFQK